MDKRYRLSIITVNLNNLEGLKLTMQSVFEQTWQEFEYIIIDGGSTDGSREYIEEHSKKIHYWVSEPDNGIYNAMNKGVLNAHGEYLLFLNSGDHFYQNKSLENALIDLTKDIVYFDMFIVEKQSRYKKEYPDKLTFSYFTKDTLPHQGSFIKSQLFNTYGLYDESLEISSDWKFFIKTICMFYVSHKKVNRVLSTHYLDGISAQVDSLSIIQQERADVLKKDFKFMMEEFEQRKSLQKKLDALRRSIKIRCLIKLGLLKKF